jgi:hypothetical protein
MDGAVLSNEAGERPDSSEPLISGGDLAAAP